MTNEGTGSKPKTPEVAALDVRRDFGDYLSRVGFGGERFVITRHNKPIAVLVSFDEYERLLSGNVAA